MPAVPVAVQLQGHSRLKQLVEWCGKDFDGLIVFDESECKNEEQGAAPCRASAGLVQCLPCKSGPWEQAMASAHNLHQRTNPGQSQGNRK